MNRNFLCIMITLLQLMNWVFATSRPFAFPQHDGAPHQQAHQAPQSHQAAGFASKKGLESMEREAHRSLRALGSRPPNCNHKCGGCLPCYASQTPSTIDHVGLDQYTNYKPEGWKCKCGTSFFNP